MDDSQQAVVDKPSKSAGQGVRIKPAAADAVAQLWATVFLRAEGVSPHTVVMTSADRHEGATEIAVAVALIGSSQEGFRVALVDGNLRHPALAERAGTRITPGLAEVIRGTARLEDALVSVGSELSILPAGQPGDSPLSLLRNEKLGGILEELAKKYDHVIIDAPAVNRYPDATILGSQCDGVVLVARAAHTPRETVAEAKRRLENARGKVFGVVLNRREYPIPNFLYSRL